MNRTIIAFMFVVFAALAATFVACTAAKAQVAYSPENHFTWRSLGNNEVEITGYTANITTFVSIPHTIAGQRVVSIAPEAFWVNPNLPPTRHNLHYVTIPNTVRYIGSTAFANNSLTTIVIPDSVTYIGDNAFSWNGISAVTIGNGVTHIGNGAFAMNIPLTSIFIPDNVTHIGMIAFAATNINAVSIPYRTTVMDMAFMPHVVVTRR